MMRACLILASALALLAPSSLRAQASPARAERPPEPPALPPEDALQGPAIPTVAKKVRVVDVSGDVAYLDLGARDGLRATQPVTFGKHRFLVIAVNETHAAIGLEGRTLALGSEGSAVVARELHASKAVLRAQRSAAAYRGQWRQPVPPARGQSPDPVPLGAYARIARPRSRTDVDLSARTSSAVPLSKRDRVVGQSELRARLRATPFETVPLALLADASWLSYWARSTAVAPRPEARVRELELRYGQPRGPLLRAGRLPSPAPTIGELDGARAASGFLGPISIGAFGGLLPDPVDGRIDDSSARFGADIALDAPETAARPYASVVAHGSTYQGEIDERKLGMLLGLRPGRIQFHAGGELSLYDEDSGFAREPLELSLAHLDAAYHGERVIAGIRAMSYVPERSERLRALLDVPRVCATEAGSAACAGVLPRRYAAGGRFAFLIGGALWLDADATYATTSDEALDHVSGRAGLRWLDPFEPAGALRASGLTLSGSGTHDIYYDRVGLQLALDARFAPEFDLSLGYGPALASYASSPRALVVHEAQLDFAWLITRALQWAWSTQAELGDDVNVLYLGTLLRMRP